MMKTIATVHPADLAEVTTQDPAHQACQILHWGFVILPIVAGIDKYLYRLTEWSMYLWAPLGRMVGGSGTFMHIAGVIEIVAGFLVAFKPKIGAPIVAAWLLGIIVNLLLTGTNLDVALRDLGLFLAALALSRLAITFDPPRAVTHRNA